MLVYYDDMFDSLIMYYYDHENKLRFWDAFTGSTSLSRYKNLEIARNELLLLQNPEFILIYSDEEETC